MAILWNRMQKSHKFLNIIDILSWQLHPQGSSQVLLHWRGSLWNHV